MTNILGIIFIHILLFLKSKAELYYAQVVECTAHLNSEMKTYFSKNGNPNIPFNKNLKNTGKRKKKKSESTFLALQKLKA